jgi:hypothetical protein
MGREPLVALGKKDAAMPGRKFASISLAGAIVLSGMAPALANQHARQHATHSIRVAESRKAESAQATKGKDSKDSQERARTALLNSPQINPQSSDTDRGTIVSVGPQARAFQRVRDIAMAPTG